MNETGQDINQQEILKMEKAIRSQMEMLIPEMQKMADDYNLAGERSQFRNVLNVAVDPTSDVEITKNFVLYQLGRGKKSAREQESPWRKTRKTGTDKKKFGLALVDAIKNLAVNAKQVVEDMGEDLNTESGKYYLQLAHCRLMQLYLGNLVRYQVYLTFQADEKKRKEREGRNV